MSQSSPTYRGDECVSHPRQEDWHAVRLHRGMGKTMEEVQAQFVSLTVFYQPSIHFLKILQNVLSNKNLN